MLIRFISPTEEVIMQIYSEMRDREGDPINDHFVGCTI